jgi:hypothetical protein
MFRRTIFSQQRTARDTPRTRGATTAPQRCRTRTLRHHEECHVVSDRSRHRRFILQWKRHRPPLRITLHELGHPQKSTPIQTDNACAAGIANDTVKQRRFKAMDMQFYWIKDRVEQ